MPTLSTCRAAGPTTCTRQSRVPWSGTQSCRFLRTADCSPAARRRDDPRREVPGFPGWKPGFNFLPGATIIPHFDEIPGPMIGSLHVLAGKAGAQSRPDARDPARA